MIRRMAVIGSAVVLLMAGCGDSSVADARAGGDGGALGGGGMAGGGGELGMGEPGDPVAPRVSAAEVEAACRRWCDPKNECETGSATPEQCLQGCLDGGSSWPGCAREQIAFMECRLGFEGCADVFNDCRGESRFRNDAVVACQARLRAECADCYGCDYETGGCADSLQFGICARVGFCLSEAEYLECLDGCVGESNAFSCQLDCAEGVALASPARSL